MTRMDDASQPPALPTAEHHVYLTPDRPGFVGIVVTLIGLGLLIATLLIVLAVKQFDVAWTIAGAIISFGGFALTVMFTPRTARNWLFWVSVMLGFAGLLVVLWSTA